MSSEQFRDEEIRFLSDQRKKALDALAAIEASRDQIKEKILDAEKESEAVCLRLHHCMLF